MTARRADGSYYECRRASRTTSWSGWSAADQYYVPAYGDMARDVRRTVAVGG